MAIQLALVGCAHIHTPGFVKRIQARNDVQVKYVWDHDPERAAQRAGELNAQCRIPRIHLGRWRCEGRHHLLGDGPA